jgi:hypothetical protein
MICLNGMNSHGFVVCDNALSELKSSADGTPVYALYRLLLESRSLVEAVALVETLAPAVGLNWVMGDPGGVVMIERSAFALAVYGPSEPGRAAYHTNHTVLCTDWRRGLEPGSGRPAPSRSSHLRFAVLQDHLMAGGGDLTVAKAQEILSSREDPDYPVSRGGGTNAVDRQIGFTLASSVWELCAKGAPLWHLAAGPPHETAWRTFAF